ncbi:MAG: DUF2784 family protein [Lyngbya sp.]|nr:DUF2784 family protein [Lyngbya sp.]
MNWKFFLIFLTKCLHFLILFFVVFGWIIPSQFWRVIHLLFVPAMILQWQFNQGTCLLTNLENKLRGETSEKQQQQGQFIKSLLERCFNPLPSDETLKKGVYGIIITSWLASAIGLWWI